MAERQEVRADDMAAFLVVREHRRHVGDLGEAVDEHARADIDAAELVRLAMIHRGEHHALDAAGAEGAQDARQVLRPVLGVADEERHAAIGQRVLHTANDVDRIGSGGDDVSEEADDTGAAGAHGACPLIGHEIELLGDRQHPLAGRRGDGFRLVHDA
jgi:hypothetical protein